MNFIHYIQYPTHMVVSYRVVIFVHALITSLRNRIMFRTRTLWSRATINYVLIQYYW